MRSGQPAPAGLYDDVPVPPPAVYEPPAPRLTLGPDGHQPVPLVPSQTGPVMVVQTQPAASMQTAQLVNVYQGQKVKSYILLAGCTVFINPLCGLLALLFSLRTISDENAGNANDARRHSKMAMRFSITGILLFLIFAILVGVMIPLVTSGIQVQDSVLTDNEWFNDFVSGRLNNAGI